MGIERSITEAMTKVDQLQKEVVGNLKLKTVLENIRLEVAQIRKERGDQMQKIGNIVAKVDGLERKLKLVHRH